MMGPPRVLVLLLPYITIPLFSSVNKGQEYLSTEEFSLIIDEVTQE